MSAPVCPHCQGCADCVLQDAKEPSQHEQLPPVVTLLCATSCCSALCSVVMLQLFVEASLDLVCYDLCTDGFQAEGSLAAAQCLACELLGPILTAMTSFATFFSRSLKASCRV